MHSLTEEHCRTDGVQIVISEYTHKLVHEFFDTRELDSVAVKGKAQGIRIFELLREKEHSSSDDIHARLEEHLVMRMARQAGASSAAGYTDRPQLDALSRPRADTRDTVDWAAEGLDLEDRRPIYDFVDQFEAALKLYREEKFEAALEQVFPWPTACVLKGCWDPAVTDGGVWHSSQRCTKAPEATLLLKCSLRAARSTSLHRHRSPSSGKMLSRICGHESVQPRLTQPRSPGCNGTVYTTRRASNGFGWNAIVFCKRSQDLAQERSSKLRSSCGLLSQHKAGDPLSICVVARVPVTGSPQSCRRASCVVSHGGQEQRKVYASSRAEL